MAERGRRGVREDASDFDSLFAKREQIRAARTHPRRETEIPVNHYTPADIARIAWWLVIILPSASAFGGLIWTVWLIRAYRRDVLRSRNGLCLHCGYDLRQSKDRCPECGQPIRK